MDRAISHWAVKRGYDEGRGQGFGVCGGRRGGGGRPRW